MRLRRSVTSLILLLAAIFSFVEPVLGQARDGEIHHRTSVQQMDASSSVDAHDPQGKKDGPAHPPGPKHQHGTNADHCTHQHAAVLVPTFAFALPAQTIEPVLLEPTRHFGRFPGRLFHPPRA